MFKKIINFFIPVKTPVTPKIPGSDDVNQVLNVDNFNIWFCDPNNNAVYANIGIFLRIDKLDQSQITDYLLKRWNLVASDIYNESAEKLIREFFNAIRRDWINKQNVVYQTKIN